MTASKPVTVMIIDDAAPLRAVLRTLLSSEGYSVVAELASGHSVLSTVASLHPDIVCLDYNLPDADGMQLLKAIHADHPATAVVMITGDEDPTLQAAAAEAGSAGFIRKPFSQERILRELEQVRHAQALLSAAHLAGEVPSGKPVRARAVVADDSATMRALLVAILTSAGVETVGEARDGRHAVELVRQQRPDIVFLDIAMPLLDGLGALAEIHAADPKVRVMMITAHAERDVVTRAAHAGALGFLVKPFHPDRIVEAIDKLLA